MNLVFFLTQNGVKRAAVVVIGGSGGIKKRTKSVRIYTPCTTVNNGKKDIYIYRRLFISIVVSCIEWTWKELGMDVVLIAVFSLFL